MNLLDATLPTLEENLALDEALLFEAEAGRRTETLRFWEWSSPGVVLGAACLFDADVSATNCRQEGVPIARRASGGGTVLLDKGCLNFSLVLSCEAAPLGDIRQSYCHILGRLCRALEPLAPGIHCSGTSDLVLGDRKVSGNAQQRKRRFLLHHGTLLYAFAGGRVARYLKQPARQPDYRQGRSHADFLVNINAPVEDLKARLCSEWQPVEKVTAWPVAETKKLVESKYRLDEWLHRR